MTEPFHISHDDCLRMTYREAWDRHVAPAIARNRQWDRETGHATAPASAESHTKSGAFEAHRATEAEANTFFDQLCGGRIYEGPRWWIPGEVPGITTYNGKDE